MNILCFCMIQNPLLESIRIIDCHPFPYEWIALSFDSAWNDIK